MVLAPAVVVICAAVSVSGKVFVTVSVSVSVSVLVVDKTLEIVNAVVVLVTVVVLVDVTVLVGVTVQMYGVDVDTTIMVSGPFVTCFELVVTRCTDLLPYVVEHASEVLVLVLLLTFSLVEAKTHGSRATTQKIGRTI